MSRSLRRAPSVLPPSVTPVPRPRPAGARPPLSASISAEFRRRVPNSEFTTNPCRIQFCTQEMVVFREDVLSKLCRHGIYYPTENCPDIPPHVSRWRGGGLTPRCCALVGSGRARGLLCAASHALWVQKRTEWCGLLKGTCSPLTWGFKLR